MLHRSMYKFVLLVILSSLQPGWLQEEQPTSGGESDAGVATAFDEIKTLLKTIKSKMGTHVREFRSFKGQMENDLRSLRGDLNSLNDSVSDLSDCLQEHKQQTAHKLAELQTSLSGTSSKLDTLNDTTAQVSSDHQEIINMELQTAHKLAEVQASLSSTKSKLDTTTTQFSTDLQEIQTKITSVEQQTVGKLAGLLSLLTNTNSKLDTLYAATAQLSTDHQEIQTNISIVECLVAEEFSQLYKYLQTNVTHGPENEEENVTNTECLQTNLTHGPENEEENVVNSSETHTCGGTGGWRRVVYLDMTDPSTICPSGWQLTGYSKRTCGRVSTTSLSCDSVTFPVSGGEYSRVCGRIKAYQYEDTDAFEAYDDGRVTTIDGAYVAGVSLTHGNPRRHIWTFAAGYSEATPTRDDTCPCDASITIHVPPFVGDDYFCESGENAGSPSGFHPDDPLWDGQNCISSSTCCSFNTPPYFVKQLPTSTTDDIEARLCQYGGSDDSPIELIELYVQ